MNRLFTEAARQHVKALNFVTTSGTDYDVILSEYSNNLIVRGHNRSADTIVRSYFHYPRTREELDTVLKEMSQFVHRNERIVNSPLAQELR